MAKNKVWVDGEPCKKCFSPVKKHKEYPKEHMYTFCFICTKCRTTYFNKRIEILNKRKLERKEKRRLRKHQYKSLIKKLYYEPKVTGIKDIISRIRDVIQRLDNGRIIRQVIIRIFEINFRKRKDIFPHGYSKEEVLEVMKEIASHNLMGKRWITKRTNSELREEYNEKKIKETWRPHVDGSICYVCDNRADIRHHIVPLKNGGSNSFRNIRVLCNNCHAKIHPWLQE